MEAYLNRAGSIGRQWLAITAATCLSGSVNAADVKPAPAAPKRIAAASAGNVRMLASAEGRDPSLFVREPVETAQISSTARAAAGTPIKHVSSAMPTPIPSFARSLRPLDSASASDSLDTRIEPDRYTPMPGFSTASLRQSAADKLDEAAARLIHEASYSATQAATEALRLIAQASDAARGDNRCSTELMSATVAIREAEDFVGRYGLVDSTAISRMVRSHETTVLKDANLSSLTGLMAADAYLDSARRSLSTIASQDPLAASAIGLLAKSYRQRADESPLGLATSVHLMRAAVWASPDDAGLVGELASVLQQAKLDHEANQVLASLPARRPLHDPADFQGDGETVIAVVSGTQIDRAASAGKQPVRVEQLSPAAFATVSRAEAGPTGSPAAPSATASPAGVANDSLPPADGESAISRSFKSMTRMWR
ncbi:MAG: hypothetical protein ACO1RT_06755 [Planctomycetaceae bacterium]